MKQPFNEELVIISQASAEPSGWRSSAVEPSHIHVPRPSRIAARAQAAAFEATELPEFTWETGSAAAAGLQ